MALICLLDVSIIPADLAAAESALSLLMADSVFCTAIFFWWASSALMGSALALPLLRPPRSARPISVIILAIMSSPLEFYFIVVVNVDDVVVDDVAEVDLWRFY